MTEDYPEVVGQAIEAVSRGYEILDRARSREAAQSGIQNQIFAPDGPIDLNKPIHGLERPRARTEESVCTLTDLDPADIAAVETLERLRPYFPDAGQLADRIYEEAPEYRPKPATPEES